MSETPHKQTSIGGIWFSQKRQGMLLMTIEIDGKKEQFVAFKNDYKKGSQPDFKVFKNRSPSVARSTPPVQGNPAPTQVEETPAPAPAPSSPFAEDVPF
jgi:hypothetical protein